MAQAGEILSHECSHNTTADNMNPGYFPLVATALKLQQIPMFLHISVRVWVISGDIHKHQNSGILCLKLQYFCQ